MLNQKNLPSVTIDDDGVQTGIGFYMVSFGRDAYPLPMVAADDLLYYGLYKPFNALYVEMGVASVITTTLSLEYWNGAAWAALENVLDDTSAFKRSGFIQWDKPSDWATTTVNAEERFFIRLAPAANLSVTTTVQGINIVFSDDQDLNGVYPGISAYLNAAETSFILRHENSRNLIVQEVRNRGFTKYAAESLRYDQLTEWDFLAIQECKQWSIYLTLANIFSSLQSNQSDLYKEKAEEYEKKAEFYKAAFFLTLDKNDDGVLSPAESAKDISTRRLVRG